MDDRDQERAERRADDGERRVDDLGREAFDRAVEAAAVVATQAVAQVHRRRLVVQSAAATFVVCMVIAFVLALSLKSAADADSRARALVNCQLVREISTPLADFVASDAHLRQRQQALSETGQVAAGFNKLFGKTVYAQALKKSNALNAATTNQWLDRDVPQLRRVAGTNCELKTP